ncbi:MAG: BatA and WFA domain-containing protein [Verrucomicrobiales bacterium]
MQFLNPGSLWLLLLGFIPVLLYLFRRRSRKIKVPTLVFFKTLAQEHQESAWLRRLKKLLSFLLTMLMLILAVFVLSRFIVRQDDADQYRTVVILLDRSASMEVRDQSGETRMDAAKRILKERLKKVPEEVGVALIVYDVRPEVIQPRTLKRRELLSRLDGVETRPMAERTDSAIETAKMIAGLDSPSAIWHASDHPVVKADTSVTGQVTTTGDEVPGDGETLLPVAESEKEMSPVIHELNLALPEATNAGISAFQLRPVPLEYSRYDAYVQVALNADSIVPAKVRLNVSVGGIPTQFRELDLTPGERSGITFRLNGSRGQAVRVWLEAEGDVFSLDDQVSLPLPEIEPLLAAWIRPDETEDPYTRLALSSIQETGTFELLKGNPDVWPLREKVDAVIFDGWMPADWPTDIPVIVINPPGSSGPVQAKKLESPIPYQSVGVENEEHPVLFRVSSGRIALAQTATFEVRGSLETLWTAGKDPVLAAGEVAGQRIVIMGFSPGMSDRLPLTASFPILMGNALFWCVNQRDLSGESRLFSTGELAPVSGSSITWAGIEDGQFRKRTLPLASDIIEMDRVGNWETDTGLNGASYLLSALESDLPTRSSDEHGNAEYFTVESGIAGNLKLWLLSSLIVVLLLESWLFHRFAVY